MSLQTAFNANSVRNFMKKSVMILLTVGAGLGVSQNVEAGENWLEKLDRYSQSANGYGGGGSWQQAPRRSVDQIEAENVDANAPWQNNSEYQVALRSLRLQTSTTLRQAELNYKQNQASCTTRFTSVNLQLKRYKPANSAERADKTARYNEALTYLQTCNDQQNIYLEQTYNQVAEYFLRLESTYARQYEYQQKYQQQYQQQQPQQYRQAPQPQQNYQYQAPQQAEYTPPPPQRTNSARPAGWCESMASKGADLTRLPPGHFCKR